MVETLIPYVQNIISETSYIYYITLGSETYTFKVYKRCIRESYMTLNVQTC